MTLSVRRHFLISNFSFAVKPRSQTASPLSICKKHSSTAILYSGSFTPLLTPSITMHNQGPCKQFKLSIYRCTINIVSLTFFFLQGEQSREALDFLVRLLVFLAAHFQLWPLIPVATCRFSLFKRLMSACCLTILPSLFFQFA